jgi:hypothetical protein
MLLGCSIICEFLTNQVSVSRAVTVDVEQVAWLVAVVAAMLLSA